MHANVSIFVPHVGCPCKCSFCNQRAISGTVDLPDAESVRIVCNSALKSLSGKTGEKEIAFFGGSFTAIDKKYMMSLLEAAQPFIASDKFSGIRISTRPDAIDEDILKILKNYGVKSIELGCQSTDDYVLDVNKRGHTYADIEKSAKMIKKHGFSLGVQMMVGLMGDSAEKCMQTCDDLIALSPDTVRIYPTVVLKNTDLEKAYLDGRYIPMGFDECVELCADMMEKFEVNNVKVIRVGLHAQREMEADKVAGIYHPAFRQICISKQIDKKVMSLARIDKNIKISFPIKKLSDVYGQKKTNLIKWKERGLNMSFETIEDTDAITVTLGDTI